MPFFHLKSTICRQIPFKNFHQELNSFPFQKPMQISEKKGYCGSTYLNKNKDPGCSKMQKE
jgi:hypothetical protein